MRQHLEIDQAIGTIRNMIARRKRQENIAAARVPKAADATQADRRALSQPLALIGGQRGIRRDDDNDRSFGLILDSGARRVLLTQLPSDRHTIDPQLSSITVVGLH